jgi:hypothetical protein
MKYAPFKLFIASTFVMSWVAFAGSFETMPTGDCDHFPANPPLKLQDHAPVIELLSNPSFERPDKIGSIFIDESVSDSAYDKLKADFEIFKNFQFKRVSPEFERFFHVKPATSSNLMNWLTQRVHYIVGPSFDSMARTRELNAPVKFSHPYVPLDRIGRVEYPAQSFKFEALNIGAGLYDYGKSIHKMVQLKLTSGQLVDITSPRVGIVELGRLPYFDQPIIGHPDSALSERVKSFKRLATLFHEARHSDGAGKALGFRHIQCPAGSEMAGEYACDSMGNGAYKAEALMLEAFDTNCLDCTVRDHLDLRVLIARAKQKIRGGSEIDDHPEYAVPDVRTRR